MNVTGRTTKPVSVSGSVHLDGVFRVAGVIVVSGVVGEGSDVDDCSHED